MKTITQNDIRVIKPAVLSIAKKQFDHTGFCDFDHYLLSALKIGYRLFETRKTINDIAVGRRQTRAETISDMVSLGSDELYSQHSVIEPAKPFRISRFE